MGQTQSVHSEIEVNQSPAEVRAVVWVSSPSSITCATDHLSLTNLSQFLDFASYPVWFKYWTLKPDNAGKLSTKLVPGDKIQTIIGGNVIDCKVVVSPVSDDMREIPVLGYISRTWNGPN